MCGECPTMRNFFSGTRYANVTATLALVVALGGTSYAAASLARNSVGSAQIKRGGVLEPDIRAGAVTSSKVRDRSLLAKDFKARQLPAGPRGATGPAGARGQAGDTGPRGPSNVIFKRVASNLSVPADCDSAFTDVASVDLPAGTWVVLGGVSVLDFDNTVDVRHDTESRLAAGGTTITGSQGFASLTEGGATPSSFVVAAQMSPRAVVTTSGAATTITLGVCRRGSTDLEVAQRSIHAIQVAAATEQ